MEIYIVHCESGKRYAAWARTAQAAINQTSAKVSQDGEKTTCAYVANVTPSGLHASASEDPLFESARNKWPGQAPEAKAGAKEVSKWKP